MPVTDWSKIEDSSMLATEFLFSPNDPVFVAGMPYRLKIRNLGGSEHSLKGPHFLRAIAIRQVSLNALIRHGADGHVDNAISPDNADTVPKIPPQKKGARDLIAENEAEAKGNNAGGGPAEAPNPFADYPADEDSEEDLVEEGAAEGVEEEAANPLAADADADQDTAETATPETPTTFKTGVDWQPVNLDKIAIPEGHEITIEFVAVKPGNYRFYSGDARYAVSGMFGTATIKVPDAE